jgi:drug/metabolite transporter (DMT)-like permease
MQLNFKVGKKLKWFLIGAGIFVVGMILFLVGGNGERANIPTILGSVFMFGGGFMAAGMVMAMIISDMEDDYYGR